MQYSDLKAEIERLKSENERIRQNSVSHAVYEELLKENELLKAKLNRQGSWVFVMQIGDYAEYKCSECDVRYQFESYGDATTYCPKCGVKMKGN